MKRDPRCKFTILEEQEMIRLYKKGLSLSEVGKYFTVGSSRVSRILKANNFKRRYHGDGKRLLHQHLIVEPPHNFPWKFHNSFSKLLAVFLLTDGYLKKGGGISLICTDEILADYFLTLIKETYKLMPTVNGYMTRGKETIVHSTKVSKELLALSPSYKTSPWNEGTSKYLQKPQPSLSFLENESLALLTEAIRIAMSCDGTVNAEFQRNTITPKLEFSCAHPILIREWQKIFTKIGIKTYLCRSNITWSNVKSLGIKESNSIKRFIEIGGFIDGVLVTGKSRYYAGITKNDLLNLLFTMNKQSFQFPPGMNLTRKNYVIKEMVLNSAKRRVWWKRGVEDHILKQNRGNEKIREQILSHIRRETKKGQYPTYTKIVEKFRKNPYNYFQGGMKDIYHLAGVKTKKEIKRERILDYIRTSGKRRHYPSYDEICTILHTNVDTFFTSIKEAYEIAGVHYPRVVKKSTKIPANIINGFYDIKDK